MQTKQDMTPRNEKGQAHGYWEKYYSNGQLSYKGSFVNGKHDGYWESYFCNGQLWYKGSYVNGKIVGLWIDDEKEYFYAN